MKSWRMPVILGLLVSIVVLVIYAATGPVIDLSYRMAEDSAELAVFRPWILCMAWVILAGVGISVAIIFIAFFRIYRDKAALYTLSSFLSLKGAAKALEVSEVVTALLILLLLIQKVRSIMILYLLIGFIISLLASQTMRLLADMIREGIEMKDDLKLTI